MIPAAGMQDGSLVHPDLAFQSCPYACASVPFRGDLFPFLPFWKRDRGYCSVAWNYLGRAGSLSVHGRIRHMINPGNPLPD
jgi:hypothetical protein